MAVAVALRWICGGFAVAQRWQSGDPAMALMGPHHNRNAKIKNKHLLFEIRSYECLTFVDAIRLARYV